MAERGRCQDRVSRYRAPAAAQGFDQRDAGSQLPAAYAQGRALIAERSGLRHDDAQIAHDPGLVLMSAIVSDSSAALVAWSSCALHGLLESVQRLVATRDHGLTMASTDVAKSA
jgi:hypothetical protein